MVESRAPSTIGWPQVRPSLERFLHEAISALLDNGLSFSFRQRFEWDALTNETSQTLLPIVVPTWGASWFTAMPSIVKLLIQYTSIREWAETYQHLFPGPCYFHRSVDIPIPLELGITRSIDLICSTATKRLRASHEEVQIDDPDVVSSVARSLSELDEFLSSPNCMHVHWFVSFQRLSIPNGTHEIEDGISLRTLANGAKNTLLDGAYTGPIGRLDEFTQSLDPSFSFGRFPSDLSTVIEIRDVRTVDEQPSVVLARDTGWRLTSALRLLLGGAVRPDQIWLQDSNPWANKPYPPSQYSSVGPSFIRKDDTVADQKVLEQARLLWPRLMELDPDGAIALALARFEDGFRRARDDERVLDCWIGLEALFTKGREGFGLLGQYRCAWWLGTDRTARVRVFNELEEAKQVRNRIVHPTESKKLDREVIKKVADSLEKILSKSLLQAIERTGQQPDLTTLDGCLLGSD